MNEYQINNANANMEAAAPVDQAGNIDAVLKLDNQLCFPLYACSREMIKQYKTQYIAMMVLWESKTVTAKELGKRLYLDSGTLTPLLKRLEGKGFLRRRRDPSDERSLLVTITEKGEALKEQAASISCRIDQVSSLTAEECEELYRLLYKMLTAAEQD